jgi:hypothetical protein
LGGSSVCFGSIETLCFDIEAKQTEKTGKKEKTEKNPKKTEKIWKKTEKLYIFCIK